MTKILPIEVCWDCPHLSCGGVCLHPDVLDNDRGQRLSDETLKARSIPHWCPLTDSCEEDDDAS